MFVAFCLAACHVPSLRKKGCKVNEMPVAAPVDYNKVIKIELKFSFIHRVLLKDKNSCFLGQKLYGIKNLHTVPAIDIPSFH
jgi:hypothetical protein